MNRAAKSASSRRLALLAVTLLAVSIVQADNRDGTKTVFGSKDIDLYDGANALTAGDSQAGFSSTLSIRAIKTSNFRPSRDHQSLQPIKTCRASMFSL